MRNKLFLLVLVVSIGIGFTACTTFRADGFQVGLNTSGVEILGDFTTNVRVNEFLGASGGSNLFNLSADAMSGPIRSAIDNEVRKLGGTAAINISITYKVGPLQAIANVLTGSIWAPATAVIKGTVIR